MRAILAALLILSATAAEARYVRVWAWAWRPDPVRPFVHTPMTRTQIRDVFHLRESQASDWARHCRVMYRKQHWLPYGCR